MKKRDENVYRLYWTLNFFLKFIFLYWVRFVVLHSIVLFKLDKSTKFTIDCK